MCVRVRMRVRVCARVCARACAYVCFILPKHSPCTTVYYGQSAKCPNPLDLCCSPGPCCAHRSEPGRRT